MLFYFHFGVSDSLAVFHVAFGFMFRGADAHHLSFLIKHPNFNSFFHKDTDMRGYLGATFKGLFTALRISWTFVSFSAIFVLPDRLHLGQEVTRFDTSLLPPFASGITWSR